MTVRCKFTCNSVTETLHWDGKRLKTFRLSAVGGDKSPENKAFFGSTPSGTIDLGLVNPESAAELVIGKEYYVDLVEAGQ